MAPSVPLTIVLWWYLRSLVIFHWGGGGGDTYFSYILRVTGRPKQCNQDLSILSFSLALACCLARPWLASCIWASITKCETLFFCWASRIIQDLLEKIRKSRILHFTDRPSVLCRQFFATNTHTNTYANRPCLPYPQNEVMYSFSYSRIALPSFFEF